MKHLSRVGEYGLDSFLVATPSGGGHQVGCVGHFGSVHREITTLLCEIGLTTWCACEEKTTNQYMNEQIKEWIYEWMNERMNRGMNVWMNEREKCFI